MTGSKFNNEDIMASKSDAFVKLILVFVISLLSFAVGTFVGKKYSDQQHKMLAYEPTNKESKREVAAKKNPTHTASQMTDEEIAKLAEEFVTDDTEEAVIKKESGLDKMMAKVGLKDSEPRKPAAVPKNVAQYTQGKFTVQVASFASEDDARKRSNELQNKGFSAFYVPANVNGKTWYRVSVGQFSTETEAKSYRHQFMQKTKIESAIIQKIVN
jgi:DedD protein